MLDVTVIPILQDNYTFLITKKGSKDAVVVDPGEAEPVFKVLKEKKLKLKTILNTHHHADHIGGNLALKEATGAEVIVYAADAHRITEFDHMTDEYEDIDVLGVPLRVIPLPGHTFAHVGYYNKDEGIFFCGDTLFAMGCGRVFEGTMMQMTSNMRRFKRLPEDTRLYCAHEYTEENARFALTIEPNNKALKARYKKVQEQRKKGEPTIPTLVQDELQTNPFLRCHKKNVLRYFNVTTEAECFDAMRQMKDRFSLAEGEQLTFNQNAKVQG